MKRARDDIEARAFVDGALRAWPYLLAVLPAAAIAFVVEKWAGGGGTVGLFGGVSLASPGWLRLLSLVPLLGLLSRGSLAGFAIGRRVASLALRVALVSTLVVALARPERIESGRAVSVVALVDVSASISDAQLDEARVSVEELRREAEKAGKSIALAMFAEGVHRVEIPPLPSPLPPFRPTPPKNEARPDFAGATDLQGALRFAYGLVEDGAAGRVLFYSDGNETRGDLRKEAVEARARGVRLYTHAFSSAGGDELMVRSLGVPARVDAGEPFEIVAELYASRPVNAVLSLFRDGLPDRGAGGPRTEKLDAGVNRVRWKTRADEPGRAAYELRAAPVESAGDPFRDRFAENNRASVVVRVAGRPRVLFVEGDAHAGTPFAALLQTRRFEVETRSPAAVPSSPAALDRYDLVVLSDVAPPSLGLDRMAALDGYLRAGGGLLVAGGANVFGAAGYTGTSLDKIIPLRFEARPSRKRSQVALALAIDRSGSMQGEKLELAKDAARASVEMLAPDDLVSVIAFDAVAEPVTRLTRAGDRARILDGIARLRGGGGTDVGAPLKEAFDELSPIGAEVKHVILLTDGEASYQGVAELCDEMARAGITVSAVGVGDGADKTLLSMIAKRGGGRFYFTDDAQDVPQIFTRDTGAAVRPALVEERTRLIAARPSELLAGIDVPSLPALEGRVEAQPKPGAEVILADERGEPMLARWRIGLGESLVWASDVKGRWAANLLGSPMGAKLFLQIARSALRAGARETIGEDAAEDARPDKRARFPSQPATESVVSTEILDDAGGTKARVTLDVQTGDGRFVDGLEGSLVIDGPDAARAQHAPLSQTGPGRYSGSFSLDRSGAQLFRAELRSPGGGALVVDVSSSVAAPWSRELLALPPDRALLARAAELSGGSASPSPAMLFDPGSDAAPERRDLRSSWLLAAVAIFLADVLARRFRPRTFRAPAA